MKYNDYLNAVYSGELAYDATGSTDNIVENLNPKMLVAVLVGDFVLAKKFAEEIAHEAAANYIKPMEMAA